MDAVDLAVSKTPPKTPPLRTMAATAPQIVASARRWANAQPQRGRQKKKPDGDNTAWQPRTSDQPKFITNQRKGFKHELKMALAAFDELPAEPTHALLEDASQNLRRCYRRLFFLDKFNTVLIKKIGEPETRIFMTPEPISQK